MCGIMGYVGSRPAGPILIDGLGRLEYRGYDSAGIAVLAENGGLSIHKRVGKLETLASAIADCWPNGHEGIGHTRWATHGKPSDINAHPHADCTGDVAVIHNGIVENYLELKTELATAGHSFSSETDTEVIPHLLEHYLGENEELVTALRKTIGRLEGAHAIVAMSRQHPGTLVTARVGNAGGRSHWLRRRREPAGQRIHLQRRKGLTQSHERRQRQSCGKPDNAAMDD